MEPAQASALVASAGLRASVPPMRIYSWNVNGIRSVAKKDCLPWAILPGAEVICLQETKAQPQQIPDLTNPEGWHGAWHSAKKPG